jgi:hypothetical protein
VIGKIYKKIHRLLLEIYANYFLRLLIYLKYSNTDDAEIIEVIKYLKQNPHLKVPLNTDPPYNYKNDYKNMLIDVNHVDGFPFVVIDGNEIFFPVNLSNDEIKHSIITALIEQHDKSPHKYLAGGFMISEGDNVVLIGASDGIFAMSILDKANKVFLFEPDILWVDALKRTFRPWRDKVEVIDKFVLDLDSKISVSLDSFMRDTNISIDYVQVDVEGAEMRVLDGAINLLRQATKLRLSICCYHKHKDADNINELLTDLNYKTTFSKGYYVMGLRKPYLRKGVIYASKT